MRKPMKEIQFTSYDDLIGGTTPESTTQVTEVALSELFPFSRHPFHVVDDAKMEELAESVKIHGVLMPGLVRSKPDGGYELISGHRRKRACELAGLETMPVFIKEYTDDEAAILVVDTNIQREGLLPSEKAKAYGLKYEAMKHQGSRKGGLSLDKIGEVAGESGKTVQRYVWLSRLSDKLLSMIDEKKLPLIPGVEISFLSPEQQEILYNLLNNTHAIVSKAQASQIREHSQSGDLTEETMKAILFSGKAKRAKITIKADKLSRYFGNDVSNDEIEKIIFQLLDAWKDSNQSA